jgi:hypothetical protein
MKSRKRGEVDAQLLWNRAAFRALTPCLVQAARFAGVVPAQAGWSAPPQPFSCGGASTHDCPVRVLAPVMSHPHPDRSPSTVLHSALSIMMQITPFGRRHGV